MLIMIGRWRNVHTDIGHDSIPSRISVCTYISYIHIHIYTKGRTMHVSNLIKPESFENQSPFPPSSRNGRIFRGTPRYIAPHPKSKGERTRNFYTRVAVPHHENRLTSNPSPPTLIAERGCEDGPFDLFAGTFISATGHRLPPLICKYSLMVIKDTLARPSVRPSVRSSDSSLRSLRIVARIFERR